VTTDAHGHTRQHRQHEPHTCFVASSNVCNDALKAFMALEAMSRHI
jgi:hypothetical protein